MTIFAVVVAIVMLWGAIGALTAVSMAFTTTYAFMDFILWWPIIWVRYIIQSLIRVIKS